MKKVLIVFMAFLMSAFYANAQMPLMKVVTDKVKALQQSGVDTVVTYHPYCIGCILTRISDSLTCVHNVRQYVIWKKNGQGYVQFFDECYTYSPQEGAKGFIDLLSKNASVIMQEKLLPVEFEKLYNGKVQRFASSVDHSDHQDFVFYINGDTVEKPIDNYVLDTRWEDDYFSAPDDKRTTPPSGKAVNINYTKNQNTYLKKLLDLAEREIEKMEFKRAL